MAYVFSSVHTVTNYVTNIRFEVCTAVAMKNAAFWDVRPCGSCKNRSVPQLLVTANVVLSSLILVTLMMEVQISSETSVLTRATQRNISEDGIFL
jgi:hypothetical protein